MDAVEGPRSLLLCGDIGQTEIAGCILVEVTRAFGRAGGCEGDAECGLGKLVRDALLMNARSVGEYAGLSAGEAQAGEGEEGQKCSLHGYGIMRFCAA